MLIVHLLVSRYLGEAFSSTAYSVNVYIVPGELALRLTRFTRADILAGKGPRIHCSFRRQRQRNSSLDSAEGRKRKEPAQTNSAAAVVNPKIGMHDARVLGAAGPSRLPRPLGDAFEKKKRPYEYVEASEEDENDMDDEGEDFVNAIRMIDEAPSSDAESSEDGDGGGGDWEYSLRPPRGKSKKQNVNPPLKGPSKQAKERNLDDDVISLSSD